MSGIIGSPAAVSEAINSAMLEIEKILLAEVRSRAPVVTGEFVASLESRITGFGVGAIGGIISAEVYSTEEIPLMEFLLLGTAPHEIGTSGQFLYNPEEGFAA